MLRQWLVSYPQISLIVYCTGFQIFYYKKKEHLMLIILQYTVFIAAPQGIIARKIFVCQHLLHILAEYCML